MFAKIYDSEKLGQILVTKEFDSENDELKVAFTLELDEVQVKICIGVSSEEAQQDLFNETDLAKAERIITDILPDILPDDMIS